MGWIPDYPDFRDYTEVTEEVRSVLGPTGALKAKKLPASVDLREHCSPVEDQGGLGSCTAHAGVGIIEYSVGESEKLSSGIHGETGGEKKAMDGCPMITFSKDWPRISGRFSRRNGLIRVSSGGNGQSTTDRRDAIR